MDEKKIRQLKNYSTIENVHFEFVPMSDKLNETTLKLTSTISLTNMVLFGKDYKLQKFQNINEIFQYFCKERYSLYEMRKEYMMKSMKKHIQMLKNKFRFLQEFLSKKIRMEDIQDSNIHEFLMEMKFDKVDDDFSYLLNIPIRQMTKTKLQELEHHITQTKLSLKKLENTSEGELWKDDLNRLKEFIKK